MPELRQLRRVAWWIFGLLVLQLTLRILPGGAAFLFGLFIIIPVTLIWSLALLIMGAWDGWVARAQPIRAISTAAAFPLAACLLLQPIARAAEWSYFLTHRPAYQRTIAGLQSGTIMPDHQGMSGPHDPAFLLDEGPPLRVAFPTFIGMFDNWSAIVHDPTHGVRQADGFGDRTPDRVRELFGGDLVDCWHLAGAYYSCTFS